MGLGHLPADPEQLGAYLLRGEELIHVLGNMREALKLADDWGIRQQRLLPTVQPRDLRGLRGGLFLQTPSWPMVAAFGPAREVAGHMNLIEAAGRKDMRAVMTDDGFRIVRIKLVEPEGLRRTRLR